MEILENGLVVLQATREAGSLANNVFSSIQQSRITGKFQKALTEESLNLYREEIHNRAVGKLVQHNIEVMVDTQEHKRRLPIDSTDSEYVEQMIEIQNTQLVNSVRRFSKK